MEYGKIIETFTFIKIIKTFSNSRQCLQLQEGIIKLEFTR